MTFAKAWVVAKIETRFIKIAPITLAFLLANKSFTTRLCTLVRGPLPRPPRLIVGALGHNPDVVGESLNQFVEPVGLAVSEKTAMLA